ncbi:DNA polymerase-3 subunit alpha (Gram-positive type) [Natranaerovirga pectinivora]|uniref:DNA polymerase-3 subunit alpha (Gram-positive type) n=1 Tax=Natranaerovirga pectinivora TaxID=682400 RepID=A0A4R3MGE4_9FIRM|nr:3'-5' exonuclease [Natranaerovirga pectinivora]TCT12167.1 DNA polymerase-3 subunit alpha (Gram-positive type) [Natranaerovirga pectinivora]
MENYIVLDLETTGMNPFYSKITEIGAIKVINGEIKEEFSMLVNPLTEIPEQIVSLTGINDKMVKDAPTIEEVLPEFLNFTGGQNMPIVGHNIIFDYSFIKYNALMIGKSFERKGIDTLHIARKTLRGLESRSLSYLCKHYNIENNSAHRALSDTKATYEILNYLKKAYYLTNKELFMPKPLHWKPKKENPITDKQRNYLEALLNRYQLSINKSIEDLTKSEASKKIDEINFQYGRRA